MEWGGVFNVARYLTDSLRGPVLQTLRRARSASLMGRTDGRDGRDGHQKCPLIFFILRYNKHYTHIYLYIYIKKLSRQISCGFKILDKLGVRIKKIKNTLLVGFFENQSKSRLFIKDFPCKIEGEIFLKRFPL